MPAEKGSRRYSLSLSLSPSLPVTCQPFNVECQGDGDVTLPAGWRPLGPTRVQRQRKTLSDCAPPGARLPRFRAPTLSAVQGTPHRNSCCHSPPARVRAPLAPTSTRIFAKSPPESRPLDSRTRLDASPPSALGRWAGSYAHKDTEGSPGTAGTRQPLLGTQLAVH